MKVSGSFRNPNPKFQLNLLFFQNGDGPPPSRDCDRPGASTGALGTHFSSCCRCYATQAADDEVTCHFGACFSSLWLPRSCAPFQALFEHIRPVSNPNSEH